MNLLGKTNWKRKLFFFFSKYFQESFRIWVYCCHDSKTVLLAGWSMFFPKCVLSPCEAASTIFRRFCLGGCVYVQAFALAVKLINARSGSSGWYLDLVWQGTRHSVPEKEPVLCALKSNCIHQLIKEWSWYALKGGLSDSILLSQRALQYRAQDRKYV